MNDNLMILPADVPANIRLIQIPDDFEQHEAYRYVTGLIAKAEENPDYKIDCECRKPKTGMIKAAERDFNLDLEASYMIGDSDRDIQCGISAGLKTMGVRTGAGCSDCKTGPECMFRDLKEAVSHIVRKESQG